MIFAIVILVILLTLAYFYLKCSTIMSFSMMMMFIIASITTFTYYETLANIFISRGYGIQWAHMGCFVLIFVLCFALLRILSDYLIGGATIDLGNPVKMGSAVVCGLISGLIISGCILVAMGLVPMQSKFLYNRFKTTVNLNSPQKAFLNTDGFVTGLYSLISRGSMASSKSFAVLHTDFLSQIHLNRLRASDEVKVLPVASKDCLQIPSGAGKKAVRLLEIPELGKVTVVRAGIAAGDIKSGGASNPNYGGTVNFYPAQLRMICKDNKNKPLAGSGKAVWPIGFLKNGKLTKISLENLVGEDVRTTKNRVVWLDVVFDVPSGYEGVLLEFKQNAVAELPAAVPSTEEIEKALDGQSGGAES